VIEPDMTPEKISQRLRRVAQMRRLCLKLRAAGRTLETESEGCDQPVEAAKTTECDDPCQPPRNKSTK
jgi:hypothetical protein